MLVLTAIHDIMKIEALLPTVQPQHAPYNGYLAGETIHDHDVALGYVLEHDAHALPSFGALPEAQRRSVRFTQAELGFNHGWLVQAEAPPGALLTPLKRLLTVGGVSSADIAFYFVHWLTDVAGAIPTPLRGSEKFVLGFPRSVLTTFIRSFPLVQKLATCTQTQLCEEYLHFVWRELPPDAQSPASQQAIRRAFGALSPRHQQILGEEMALTGVHGQAYTLGSRAGGPAFLVYYSPAFIRQCAQADGVGALEVLAETYRAARSLWPLCAADADACDSSVIVRIDQLKGGSVADIRADYALGLCWVLSKKNEKEAVVERCPLSALLQRTKDTSSSDCEASLEVLRFWTQAEEEVAVL